MQRPFVPRRRGDACGRSKRRRPTSSRLLAGCACILGTLALAACTVPEPPGAAPLRYRDQAFSKVAVTSDIQYGSAPDLNGNPQVLTLDLYQPVGDTNTSRPAVIWAHPGG